MASEDKVSYGESRKIYDRAVGSFEVMFNYTTTVNEGETVDDAARRCIGKVQQVIDSRIARKEAYIAKHGSSPEAVDARFEEQLERAAKKK